MPVVEILAATSVGGNLQRAEGLADPILAGGTAQASTALIVAAEELVSGNLCFVAAVALATPDHASVFRGLAGRLDGNQMTEALVGKVAVAADLTATAQQSTTEEVTGLS